MYVYSFYLYTCNSTIIYMKLKMISSLQCLLLFTKWAQPAHTVPKWHQPVQMKRKKVNQNKTNTKREPLGY